MQRESDTPSIEETHRADEASGRESASPGAQAANLWADGFCPKVLVVEDEIQLARLTVRMLERLGCVAKAVDKTAKAENLLLGGAERFDLVYTDQNLTDGTGTSLCLRIKERFPGLPVIICSGNRELLDEAARGSGAAAYLEKPVTLTELAEALKKALE